MNQFDLKAQFTEEFFEEFQFDAEFRSIFESMTRGLTPYEAIEHLCKSKKELFQSLERAIENTPTKIIVTTERFEQLNDETKNSKNKNMGQLRFSMYAHWQIGAMIKVDEYSIDVQIPFITMHFALTKYAKGIELFGKYIG